MTRTSDMRPLDLINPPLEGVNLIEASAGTGKTYAITAIFLHLLIKKKLPVDRILVVTFTVAATEELKGRIRAMLRKMQRAFTIGKYEGDDDRLLIEGFLKKYAASDNGPLLERLGAALRNFDRAAIFTIHGFCQRMLQDNPFEAGTLFDTELLTEDKKILHETAADFFRRNLYDAPAEAAARAIKNGITPEGLVGILQKRSLDPGTSVAPRVQRPEASAIENARDSAAALLEEASKLWEKGQAEVKELIENAVAQKNLSGNKIRTKSLEKRFAELDGFIAAGDLLGDYEKIHYFTSSNMVSATNKGKETPSHPFLDAWEKFHKARGSLEEILDDYVISLKAEFIENAGKLLAESRKRRNVRTFDDLLTEMHAAVTARESSPMTARVRERFGAALIDEFQDTDPLQYEIFSTIFDGKENSLYMIGDPKQAIYKFRGADIFAYLKAAGQCSRRYSLLENHRSGPGLVAAVNTVFSRLTEAGARPFVLEGIGFAPVSPSSGKVDEPLPFPGAPLTIWFIDESYSDRITKSGEATINRGTAVELGALHTAREIGRILAAGCSADKIAVLVRMHHQARKVAKHLRDLGIPCVIYGTESVFVTREAVELERVLSSIADPSNTGLLFASMSTEFWGKSGSDIASLSADEEKLSSVIALTLKYRHDWEKEGFMPMFRRLLRDLEVGPRLVSYEDGERRFTNVLHLAEILHRAEQEERLGAEGLLKFLRRMMTGAEPGEETKLRLETDDRALRIITIHKSKGLQFPIVFCPCLFDPVTIKGDFSFHELDDDGGGSSRLIDIGTRGDERIENLALAAREELSESLRLMYVALTRAKDRCYMVWGAIDKTELSAPFYAFHHGRIPDWDTFINDIHSNDKDVIKAAKDSIASGYAERLADLRDLEASSGGAVLVTGLPEGDAPRYRAAESARALTCRTFSGVSDRRWSLTSFSSLTHSAGDDQEWRDRDSEAAPPAEEGASGAGYSIHNFPRGTRAGLFIHSVFEKIDFAAPGSPASRELIKSLLHQYGFDEAWHETVTAMALNVLSAPLTDGVLSFRLADLLPKVRLPELEFYFPMASLAPSDIAALVLQGRDDIPSGWKSPASRLEVAPVGGFVRGFIDLVFSHDGRYYIADWKSNHLGPDANHYTAEKMADAMASRFYHLQYHLYAIALHRHLKRALPGYRYEEHFGGAFYLFIRGMDPATPGRGVFFDRPARELIEKLDARIAGRDNG